MRFLTAWQKPIAIALIALLVGPVLAEKNIYDKFRNHEYSNKGYMSEEDELKLGAEVHKQLMSQTRFLRNTPLNTYVENLGNKLAQNSRRPNIPWKFYIVEDDSVNAFATLGGYVYVHTGLLAKTQSESQLASVLGHEIGHIVARHGLENVKKAKRYGTLAGIAVITGAVLAGQGGAGLGNLAGNLILGGRLMKHSRDAEREADYLGLYDMNRAGYNTAGMVQMFEILEQISQTQPSTLGSIMASHPPAAERANNTRVEISQKLAGSDHQGITNTPEFQRVKGGGSGGGEEPVSPRRIRPRN
ncbi:MAG: M48 family metalloprotease [Blastocatellia bacterium]|nr:M48 family metalloprotease [Blastocatellia bacterium]